MVGGDAGPGPISDHDGQRCEGGPHAALPAQRTRRATPRGLTQHRGTEPSPKPDRVLGVLTPQPEAYRCRRRADSHCRQPARVSPRPRRLSTVRSTPARCPPSTSSPAFPVTRHPPRACCASRIVLPSPAGKVGPRYSRRTGAVSGPIRSSSVVMSRHSHRKRRPAPRRCATTSSGQCDSSAAGSPGYRSVRAVGGPDPRARPGPRLPRAAARNPGRTENATTHGGRCSAERSASRKARAGSGSTCTGHGSSGTEPTG